MMALHEVEELSKKFNVKCQEAWVVTLLTAKERQILANLQEK